MSETIQPGFLARAWRTLTNPTIQSKIMRSVLAGAPIAAITKILGAGWATSLGAGAAAGTAAWWAPKLDQAYRLQQRLLQLNPNAIYNADNIYYASADGKNKSKQTYATLLQDMRNTPEYAKIRQAHDDASNGEFLPLQKVEDSIAKSRRDLYDKYKSQLDKPGYSKDKAEYWIRRAVLNQFKNMTQKDTDYTTTLAKLYDTRLSRKPWWSKL